MAIFASGYSLSCSVVCANLFLADYFFNAVQCFIIWALVQQTRCSTISVLQYWALTLGIVCLVPVDALKLVYPYRNWTGLIPKEWVLDRYLSYIELIFLFTSLDYYTAVRWAWYYLLVIPPMNVQKNWSTFGTWRYIVFSYIVTSNSTVLSSVDLKVYIMTLVLEWPQWYLPNPSLTFLRWYQRNYVFWVCCVYRSCRLAYYLGAPKSRYIVLPCVGTNSINEHLPWFTRDIVTRCSSCSVCISKGREHQLRKTFRPLKIAKMDSCTHGRRLNPLRLPLPA